MYEKLEKAITFATKAHSGQLRKFGKSPYILHPLEAASIAGAITNDEDVLCACLLHDTVEDTDCTAEDIQREFGERVAFLVASETENKRPDLPKSESWQIRKEESLKVLADSVDIGVKILWLSDKLANMRSYYRGYLESGDEMWNCFNQCDKSKHAWYMTSVAKALKDSLGTTAPWLEFATLIKKVFDEDII